MSKDNTEYTSYKVNEGAALVLSSVQNLSYTMRNPGVAIAGQLEVCFTVYSILKY